MIMSQMVLNVAFTPACNVTQMSEIMLYISFLNEKNFKHNAIIFHYKAGIMFFN